MEFSNCAKKSKNRNPPTISNTRVVRPSLCKHAYLANPVFRNVPRKCLNKIGK